MSISFWVWLAVIVLTIVLEVITMELVSIWFTAGAVVPFIMAAAHDAGGWEWQLVIFFIISAVLILALRPVTKKWLSKGSSNTNLDAVVGKSYRLIGDITFDNNGKVKINDVVWSAVSHDGSAIPEGTIVEIVKVDGNKMVVKPAKNRINYIK